MTSLAGTITFVFCQRPLSGGAVLPSIGTGSTNTRTVTLAEITVCNVPGNLMSKRPAAVQLAIAAPSLRVTLTFNPESAADRERIARVYRHARVVLHETRDTEVSIVADVPRRLLNRLG